MDFDRKIKTASNIKTNIKCNRNVIARTTSKKVLFNSSGISSWEGVLSGDLLQFDLSSIADQLPFFPSIYDSKQSYYQPWQILETCGGLAGQEEGEGGNTSLQTYPTLGQSSSHAPESLIQSAIYFLGWVVGWLAFQNFIILLARATLLYKSLFCMLVWQSVCKFFLASHWSIPPVPGNGSGIPNQRLRVFVLFQLSTTWLNSTVKRSLTSRNRIEILA